jgi:hypothetical protein
MSRQTICIDFDRTLHDMDNPVEGRKMGGPIPGSLAAVRVLQHAGFDLVVLTAQPNHKYIYDWLRYYQYPPMRVTSVKPPAVAYIDDRAVRFESWGQTLLALDEILELT